MPVAWPPAIMQDALLDGYREGFDPAARLESEMDAGPDKVRLRFSAAADPIEFAIDVADADLDTFISWYRDTTKRGALSFERNHPRTGDAIVCRFARGFHPSPEPLGRYWWMIKLSLLVLP
jgi:hypothetical protein